MSAYKFDCKSKIVLVQFLITWFKLNEARFTFNADQRLKQFMNVMKLNDAFFVLTQK